jgi:hypothetical protein
MGFFDLKFIIIILLTIIVYLLYREIIDIKYKIGFLFNNNNKKIIKNNSLDNILSDFQKESDETEKLVEQTEQLEQLEQSEQIEQPEKNNTFLNRCVVKTIKIPLNLNSFLNPFEKVCEKKDSIQIIELSSSNIEDVTSSKNNSPEISQFFENNNPYSVFSNDAKNLETIEETNETSFDKITQNKTVEETNNKINLEINSFPNETTENNADNKSYASSSHIEIYSNDDLNPDTSVKSSICDNVLNKSNIDYKNILKNLTKYKLPELQDLVIQFKLPKENNNKKKTRLELIEEIKNYISNKNI